MVTARIRSSIGPVYAVSHACNGVSRHRAAPVEFDKDGCHLVIGATGNIGPHLIRQLADMGAATVVAVSRNPGSRLDELAASLSETGTTLVTVAADAADAAAMAALFDRFGADLPPLHGIYLAAFGGGPVTLADMTDDDVDGDVPAEARRGVGVAQPVAATTRCASSCCSRRSPV